MALQDLALAARYYELLGGREDLASPSNVASLRDRGARKESVEMGNRRVRLSKPRRLGREMDMDASGFFQRPHSGA
jgi:hypothetical protein